MNAVKLMAMVLIVASILGLAYGSFSYTKETHGVKLGSLELSVKDKQTVSDPRAGWGDQEARGCASESSPQFSKKPHLLTRTG